MFESLFTGPNVLLCFGVCLAFAGVFVLAYENRKLKCELTGAEAYTTNLFGRLQSYADDLDSSRETQRRLHRRAQAAESFETQTLRPLKAELALYQGHCISSREQAQRHQEEASKYYELAVCIGMASNLGEDFRGRTLQDLHDLCRDAHQEHADKMDAMRNHIKLHAKPCSPDALKEAVATASPLLNKDYEGL